MKNPIQNFILEHSLISKFLLFAFNVLFFCCASYFLPIMYETNDDIDMCLTANGCITGIPDCHLIYPNALYGCLVAFLYSMISGIEWYSVMYAIFHIISFSLIVWYIIKLNQHYLFRILLLLFSYSIWLNLIIAFEFTTTAALLAIAGCLSCFSSKKKLAIGMSLVILASLIRFESAGLIGLIFIPVALFTHQLKWKKYIPFFILIIIVLSLKYVDRFFYSSPQWQQFEEYNNERGAINDSPSLYKVDPNILRENGINMNNYKLFCIHMHDPENLSIDQLKIINKLLHDIPNETQYDNIRQLSLYRVPLILLLFITIGLFFAAGTKTDKCFTVVISLWLYIILISLSISYPVKYRVFICAFFATILFISRVSIRKESNIIWIVMIYLSMLGQIAKYSNRAYKISKAKRNIIATDWLPKQKPMLDALPEYSICGGYYLYIDLVNPFKIKDLKMIPIGLCNLPYNNNSPVSFPQIFLNEKFYMFTSTNQPDSAIQYLRDYVLEQYDITMKIDTINRAEPFCVVQFKQQY